MLDASRVVDVVVEPDERRAPRRVRARPTAGCRRRCGSSTAQRKEQPLLPYETALREPPDDRLGRRDAARAAVHRPPRRRTCRSRTWCPYIDWTFFFAAWELKGRYPAILEHPEYGKAARDLYDSAQVLLDRIVGEKLLTATGVYGFWPAASEDDDIVVYRDREHTGELARFNLLRQQEVIADGKPNLSLADFIAPRSALGAGRSDYLGAFAVTAGIGADALAKQFEGELDDYSAILVKALADRFAEAFAAYLHQQVARRSGASTRRRSVDDVHHEAHRGIRPAFGYPACPDHSEKFKLFDLLERRPRSASR